MTTKHSSGDINTRIGKLLRVGAIASCCITLLGGVAYLFQRSSTPDYSPVADSEPFGAAGSLRSLSGIIDGILHFDGAAIIQFGVIVLIATPVLRVALSALLFIGEKDRLYTFISFLVLLIIAANMLLGN
jgi:uncharacterized membrane protein